MIPEGVLQLARVVVGLLVKGEYTAVEAMTQGKRVSAKEMASAVSRYGRKLIYPPESAMSEVHIFETEGTGRQSFAVDFPLWTEEEGRSDLEIRMTLTEVMDGIYSVMIDDILVP